LKELNFWHEIPALSREAFLAINATNKTPELWKKNDKLLKNNQTGDWKIKKEVIDAGLIGKLVLLFYKDKKGQSIIYAGTVVANEVNSNNNYRLTVKEWQIMGVTHTTFTKFFSGFSHSAVPCYVWKGERDYPLAWQNEIFEEQIQKSLANPREERLARLSKAKTKPQAIQVVTTAFQRNPDVVAEVLFQAAQSGWLCSNCKSPAPFNRKNGGFPYLEVHHMKRLADGGDDTVENAVALCPNCHRKFHFGA